MRNKTLTLFSLACLSLVASADQVPDALARYYRENSGRVLCRLPTWIVPENAFHSISNLDFDEATRGVTDRPAGVWHGTWQTGDALADVPAPLAALTPNWVKLHAAGLAASRGEDHVDTVVSRILVEVAKLKAADPDAVPMAFWDFDGTIIKGDVSEGYAKDGVVGFRGLLEETIRAGLCTTYRGEEGWRAFRRDYPTLRRLGRWLAWPCLGQMYHGTKAADIDALCRARFRDVYAKWYYASSVEILRRLEAAGVENHIISASPELFVRNGGASLGLEATRMNGLRVGIDGGYVSTRIEEPVAMGEGKVEVLRRIVNARPHARAVAGFGDSYFTDGPFLRYVATQRLPGGAKGFAMMINGKEKNPEYDGLFLCVSQQKTVADGVGHAPGTGAGAGLLTADRLHTCTLAH